MNLPFPLLKLPNNRMEEYSNYYFHFFPFHFFPPFKQVVRVSLVGVESLKKWENRKWRRDGKMGGRRDIKFFFPWCLVGGGKVKE